MAGLGKKTFAAGEVLTASNVNGYLMDQSVMAFADSTTRAAAVTVPTDGMVSYLQDTNTVEQYRVFTNTGGTAVGAWDALSSGRGNAIINGDFAINQRAFSSTTTTGTYGFDRWQTVIAGDGTTTYSAQTFTAGTAPVAGYEAQNFARLVTTGQSTAAVVSELRQLVEDVRTFAGQTVTVSFWAKAASGTPKVAIEFEQNFGSGGSPSSAVQIYAGQVTLSTSWARYALTVALPSISGKTIGSTVNSSFLSVGFWTSAGSTFASRTGTLGIQSATIDFWGVQVEAGAVVSPFRTATGTKQGELAACQRYYIRLTGGAGAGMFGHATAANTGQAYAEVYLPTTMRTNPSTTLDWTGTIGNYTLAGFSTGPGTVSNFLAWQTFQSPTSMLIQINGSGLTTNAGYSFVAATSAAYIGFNAEL